MGRILAIGQDKRSSSQYPGETVVLVQEIFSAGQLNHLYPLIYSALQPPPDPAQIELFCIEEIAIFVRPVQLTP